MEPRTGRRDRKHPRNEGGIRDMERNANSFLRCASGFAGVCAAALLVASSISSHALAQPVVSVNELVALGPGGLVRSEFCPGEGIRYRARLDAAAGEPYNVRLVITGNGWYETHDAGLFTGGGTIEWGGPGAPLYTDEEAYPGKVSLILDVRAEGGEPAVVRGRAQGYITIRCPDGLPGRLSKPLPVGLNPWDMAFSKDNRYLYVTSQDRRTVTVIDLDPADPGIDWEIVTVLPENWETINRQILACQQQCDILDSLCFDACVREYATVGRPAGVAAADLASAGQRMVVADYQMERVHIIERDGTRHWLGGDISIPRAPPFNQPIYLMDVVVSEANEVFATDWGQHRVFRINLAPPHRIVPITLRPIPFFFDIGNSPIEILLDPLAPNENFYALAVAQVIKITRTGAFLNILDMRSMTPGALPPSLVMRLNPDPARRGLYVLKGPAGPIDAVQPEPSANIYFWNLEDAVPTGDVVRYESSLWDIAPIQKGALRGRYAYVLDAYRGQLRLLNLESRKLLRDCGILLQYEDDEGFPVVSIGAGRILDDPVRDRVYVTSGAAGVVRYLSGAE